MKTKVLHCSSLLLCALLSGCALTADKIGLDYTLRGLRDKVSGADGVKVDVQVADKREVRDNVGRKINGFGNEMGAIVATNDVAQLVKSAIEAELTQRGFSRGGTVVVAVELNKFYNRFKTGFWSGDSIAEIVLGVQVKDRSGVMVYSKQIVAEGLEPGIQVAAGHNAKASLEAALWKAVDSLFQDPGFVPSLFKASGSSPPGIGN